MGIFTFILIPIGYAIAVVALIVGATVRRPSMNSWVRGSIFALAGFATVATTIVLGRYMGFEKIGLFSLIVVSVLAVLSVPLGVLIWLFAEFVGQVEVMSADRPAPPDADMSFLESASEQVPDDTKEERVPGVLERMNRPTWRERISKMRPLHRWSFMQRPPE